MGHPKGHPDPQGRRGQACVSQQASTSTLGDAGQKEAQVGRKESDAQKMGYFLVGCGHPTPQPPPGKPSSVPQNTPLTFSAHFPRWQCPEQSQVRVAGAQWASCGRSAASRALELQHCSALGGTQIPASPFPIWHEVAPQAPSLPPVCNAHRTPPRKPTPGTVPWVLVHRGGQGRPRHPGEEKEGEEGVKQLPSSRQEQVGAPQPGDGGSWDLLGMCQGCWLPCGEAMMCSQRTWDRGYSPALLWALAAQLSHLFQEDPEDPARCPGAGSSTGGAHGAGGHRAPHHHRRQLQPHCYGVALGWVPLDTSYTYRWPWGPGGPVPAWQPRRSQQLRVVHPKPSWLPWQTGHTGWPWGTGWPSWTLEEKDGMMAECVPPLPASRTGTHPHSPAGSPGRHRSQSPPCQ